MTDFKALQSELATYKNAHPARPAQAAKYHRQDRAQAYAAMHTADDLLEDTLDREFALAARIRFDEDAAHSREWVRSHADDSLSRDFFGLPANEEDY